MMMSLDVFFADGSCISRGVSDFGSARRWVGRFVEVVSHCSAASTREFCLFVVRINAFVHLMRPQPKDWDGFVALTIFDGGQRSGVHGYGSIRVEKHIGFVFCESASQTFLERRMRVLVPLGKPPSCVGHNVGSDIGKTASEILHRYMPFGSLFLPLVFVFLVVRYIRGRRSSALSKRSHEIIKGPFCSLLGHAFFWLPFLLMMFPSNGSRQCFIKQFHRHAHHIIDHGINKVERIR
mmetsp:Transcript_25337/g.52430  ORF Transcript_25337/g.52430 Transcript_25337/m.52430 type:complete len:237 (-) Transcript_25337:460-1170(-)